MPFIDDVLARPVMRLEYLLLGLVAAVFSWSVAITWHLLVAQIILVPLAAAIAMTCAWMTFAPSRRRKPMAMRGIALVAIGAFAALLAVGAGAADEPPVRLRPRGTSPYLTAKKLRAEGFRSARVVYPSQTNRILVTFDGPPSVQEPDAVDRVARVVWVHEEPSFDWLTIADGTAVRNITYQELALLLGPRPKGFDQFSVEESQTLGEIGRGIFEGLDEVGREVGHFFGFVTAGLIAAIALGAIVWSAYRRSIGRFVPARA